MPPPPRSTLFPYTTLFRSGEGTSPRIWMVNRFTATAVERMGAPTELMIAAFRGPVFSNRKKAPNRIAGYISQPERSEEHTSELQSRFDLVCRLLLEKKKKN